MPHTDKKPSVQIKDDLIFEAISILNDTIVK
jgi:hypothetical protein